VVLADYDYVDRENGITSRPYAVCGYMVEQYVEFDTGPTANYVSNNYYVSGYTVDTTALPIDQYSDYVFDWYVSKIGIGAP
jgi:hypothetical protein